MTQLLTMTTTHKFPLQELDTGELTANVSRSILTTPISLAEDSGYHTAVGEESGHTAKQQHSPEICGDDEASETGSKDGGKDVDIVQNVDTTELTLANDTIEDTLPDTFAAEIVAEKAVTNGKVDEEEEESESISVLSYSSRANLDDSIVQQEVIIQVLINC